MGVLGDTLYSYINGISSLTQYDTVKIITSFEAMHQSRINCFQCQSQSEKIQEKVKKAMSCYGLRENVVTRIRHYDTEISYYSCPGNYFDNSFSYIFDMYKSFSHNKTNPLGESIVDMPNKLYEAFRLLDNLSCEYQAKEQAKWQTKSRSNSVSK